MQTTKLDNVIFDIKTILAQNPAPIKRVGLFGSFVKGKFHENSDIDIAIEYDESNIFNFEGFVAFCKTCEMLADGMQAIYKRKIDVIDIEERPGSFLDEIRDDMVWI